MSSPPPLGGESIFFARRGAGVSGRRSPRGRQAAAPPAPNAAIMNTSAAVAQLAEQRTFNPKVVGSIPTGGIGTGLHVMRSRHLIPGHLSAFVEGRSGCRQRLIEVPRRRSWSVVEGLTAVRATVDCPRSRRQDKLLAPMIGVDNDG